ncbi:MAG: hypothetical protein V3S82_05945 [Dehalococcoidia bacterium]
MAQTRRPSSHLKIASVLWIVAFMVVMVASILWIVLSVMTGDYLSNSKAVRDAAEAGSTVLALQGTIAATQDWVLPFAFVGVATFILGFGFAFTNILRNVRFRGSTMAAVLPKLKQRKSKA